MDPALRVVATLPLTELWDERGPVDAERLRSVGASDVRDLLRTDPRLRFVLADVGLPLRWISAADHFRFWKEEFAPHLVEPADVDAGLDVDELPDGLAYVAEAWRSADGATVVVATAYH